MTIERHATKEEIAEIEVREGRKIRRPHVVSESIGRVAGLEALYAENDLRELLVLDLGEHIREFRDVDIKSLTESALKRWVKWATGVEATLERGIVILRAGQALLTAGNLDPLVQTLTTSDEKKQFRAFLQALSSRVPSGDPERNNRESARDS